MVSHHAADRTARTTIVVAADCDVWFCCMSACACVAFQDHQR